MNTGRSLKERFAQDKPLFSVEFFPPKDDAGGERMLKTASLIQPHKPDFVSITYGAGGTLGRPASACPPLWRAKWSVVRANTSGPPLLTEKRSPLATAT